MLRLFNLYQEASAPAAIAILVASNLLPIVGVLFWGWNLWSIIILYWIENGIVGVLNVPKMLLARGDGASGATATAGRLFMTGFFCIHYGLFWFVHGIFVWVALPLFAGFGSILMGGNHLGVGVGPAFSAVRGDVLQWGALALLISHVASFFLNYIGRREYVTRSIAIQMFAPYPRVAVLHVTILLGAFATAALGQPIAALVILVGLKTAIDLWLHLREHGSKPGPTVIEGAGQQPGA